MGFVSWIFLGLIAGSIVRKIAPGHIEGGWMASLILGVAGGVVGGWIGSFLFKVDPIDGFFDLSTWIFAIIGGVVVSYVYSFIKGKSD